MSTIDHPAQPLRATSLARLAVDPAAGDGLFLPWGSDVAHFAEAHAVCIRGEDHAAPASGCDCGFAGAYDVASLLDLIEPTPADLAGAAMLDVELRGPRWFDGEEMARAAEQHVMGAAVVRWCAECQPEDIAAHGPARLYGLDRTVGLRHMQGLVTRCEAHLGTAGLQAFNLADAAGLLRTEVTWAPDEVVGALLDRRRARLLAGQRRGPILGERRVAQLRMGQVGYTTLDSLRLDGQARLWVDLDGPAPQRSVGAAVVAVHQPVGRGLELVVARNAATRIDAAIGRVRPPILGRREARIVRIEGMEHLPRLVDAWARAERR
jgi:hypothetical protein